MSMWVDYFARLEDRLQLEQRALWSELGRYRDEYLRRRWVSHDSYLVNIRVPFLDVDEDVEVEIDEAAGVYRYPSPMQRSRIVTQPLSDIMLYAFRVEAWLDALTDLIGLEPLRRSRHREKVKGHLWHLGDLRIRGTHSFAPVFVGRFLQRAPSDVLQTALADPIHPPGGVVFVTQVRPVALPNDHQERALETLVREQEGCSVFDADALDRVLRGMPTDPGDPLDEYFDEKSGRLKLKHLSEAVTFIGVQKKIIAIFWKAREGEPLNWAQVKRESGSAAKGIDRAFGKDDPWTDWIVRVDHGRYRIRAGNSPP